MHDKLEVYEENVFSISRECFSLLKKTRRGAISEGYYRFYDFIDRFPLNNPNEARTLLCIGYDHKLTQKKVKEDKIKNKMTENEAMKYFLEDIRNSEISILKNIPYKLDQHRFDALVMLVFDIGEKTFIGSTFFKSLIDSLKKRDCDLISLGDFFLLFKTYKGEYSTILYSRRSLEREIWRNGYTREMMKSMLPEHENEVFVVEDNLGVS